MNSYRRLLSHQTWIFVAVIVVCVLLYFPGLSGPFLFDDTHTVENNEFIKIETIDMTSLSSASNSFVNGGREIAMLSFALNHYFLGHDSFGYKAVNLGIHILTGFLLFLLTRVLVSRLVPRVDFERNPVFRWSPVLVAGLWLLSPINLTTVLYVSQRMNSLAAFFVVAGVLFYLYARIRYLESGKYGLWAYAAIAICLVAGYNCKENGLLLVPLLVLVEFVVFRFNRRDGTTNWTLVFVIAGLATMAVFLAAIVADIDFGSLIRGYTHRPFTLEERVLTQGRLLIFYIGLVLFPLAPRFGLWHDDIAISTSLIVPFDTLTSIALLVMLIGIAFVVRKRYPLCSLGIFWYFIGHSMESTFIPLEMVHEHRNYLPAFGVVLTIVAMLGYLERVRPVYKLLLLGALAATASFNLHARALAWSDEYGHSMHEFVNHPTSPRATFEFGAANLRLAFSGVEGTFETALTLFERGRTLNDETILPEVAMLLGSSSLKDEYDIEWIELASELLLQSGGSISDAMALRGLRECMARKECKILAEDITPLYEAAADSKFAVVIDEAARFYFDIGDSERGLEAQGRAARRAGSRVDIRLNYIWSLVEAKKIPEAKEQFQLLSEQGIRIPVRHRRSFEDIQVVLDAIEQAGG
jgi:protein O-mannosyl-transferase